MNESTAKMTAVLKTVVVQELRSRGFSGSFPHFRRIREKQIDLITFQFSQWGGQFAVNVLFCPANGRTLPDGKHIPPSKVTADNVGFMLPLRLGSKPPKEVDHWFRFDAGEADVFNALARDVLSLIGSQAETFWQEQEQKK